MIWLAAAALVGAILAWWPANPSVRLTRALKHPDSRRGLGHRQTAIVLIGVGLLVTTVASLPLAGVWPSIGIAITGTTAFVLRGWMRDQTARRDSASVAHACDVVAGQLRIGQIPLAALSAAADDCRLVRPAVDAAAMGADVSTALAGAAHSPGRAGLGELAAAWWVCDHTGAPMAGVISTVAEAVRQDDLTHSEVAAELADARASGLLMAFLPGVGLLLGFVAGGDPIDFLIGTLPGQLCLAGATGLACSGLLWTQWLAGGPWRQR